MEEEKKFEIEVLTRLTKIETMLEDFKGVESKSIEAYNLSKENEKLNQILSETNTLKDQKIEERGKSGNKRIPDNRSLLLFAPNFL